jgi:hypothetical protein
MPAVRLSADSALGLFLCSRNASAQSVDKEPAAIVELGGAAGWDFKGGGSSFGPDLAVEVTPIENWLELEAGTTPLFRRHSASMICRAAGGGWLHHFSSTP